MKFLTFQYNYQNLNIALSESQKIITIKKINKLSVLKNLIPTLNKILKKENCQLNMINFISANIGPAPLNTLRALLTTLNGFKFCNKNLNLIQFNALDLLENEFSNNNTVVLLNAFANQVFYKIKIDKFQETGKTEINSLIKKLENFQTTKLFFIGNGVKLFKEKLLIIFKNSKFYTKKYSFNSIKILIKESFKAIEAKNFSNNYLSVYTA